MFSRDPPGLPLLVIEALGAESLPDEISKALQVSFKVKKEYQGSLVEEACTGSSFIPYWVRLPMYCTLYQVSHILPF